MAGIPKWESERIQTLKEAEGIDSDDEQFIDQLVEADMQITSLSLSQNPPVMTIRKTQSVSHLKTDKEPKDSQIRKRKTLSTYQNQGKEKAPEKRNRIETEEMKGAREPDDHYPLKEQKKGAWYIIFNTPRDPPRTPTH